MAIKVFNHTKDGTTFAFKEIQRSDFIVKDRKGRERCYWLEGQSSNQVLRRDLGTGQPIDNGLGKKAQVHEIAWKTYRSDRQPDKTIQAQEVLNLLIP